MERAQHDRLQGATVRSQQSARGTEQPHTARSPLRTPNERRRGAREGVGGAELGGPNQSWREGRRRVGWCTACAGRRRRTLWPGEQNSSQSRHRMLHACGDGQMRRRLAGSVHRAVSEAGSCHCQESLWRVDEARGGLAPDTSTSTTPYTHTRAVQPPEPAAHYTAPRAHAHGKPHGPARGRDRPWAL